jgi:hypothetical protein
MSVEFAAGISGGRHLVAEKVGKQKIWFSDRSEYTVTGGTLLIEGILKGSTCANIVGKVTITDENNGF